MRRAQLHIDKLQAWAVFNGVKFHGVAVASGFQGEDAEKGAGLVATTTIEGGDDDAHDVLLTVPQELVLSRARVEECAKFDPHLRETLTAVGDFAQTARGAILIFLLLQITNASPDVVGAPIGVSTPLTDYVKFLPESYPLPTFYSDEERECLCGTSLSDALGQKLSSLQREFEMLRNATESIGWCRRVWWDDETPTLTLDDWKLVDAMYRSRAVDLPKIGHSMVPLLDMANHACDSKTAARFDVDGEGNAMLLLRHGVLVTDGEEITILYGSGGACEMIFSYGFLDASTASARELFLSFDLPSDDPLRRAKMAVALDAPGVRLHTNASGQVEWEGGMVWWACANEDDGLGFEVLQSLDGRRELLLQWKGVPLLPSALKATLLSDSLGDIFRLRAIVLVQERIEQQGALLAATDEELGHATTLPRVRRNTGAMLANLRGLELALLTLAYQALDQQKEELLDSETVSAYLANQAAEGTGNGNEEVEA